MIIKENAEISKISWIHRGGLASMFYEPENISEFIDLINQLNRKSINFLVVGHTSNIYFKNSFNIDALVSTRKLNDSILKSEYVECECGLGISGLSRRMVELGVKGYEGLVDLPGTVGAAIYGNAGCYDCLVSELLIKAEVLLTDGTIRTLFPEDFKFSHRDSILKRGQLKGYITRVFLKTEKGDKEEIIKVANLNRKKRKLSSPPPSNNLGTTYCRLGCYTKRGG